MSDHYGIQRAATKAREWTEARDRRICIAHDDGLSLRMIAAFAGLTHAGVAKIVKRA